MTRFTRPLEKPLLRRIAAVAALGLGALAASPMAARAAEPQAGTTLIALDGFCDVLTLTVFAWNQAGEYDTACGTNGIGSGMFGKVTGVKPKDLTIGETYFGDTNATYLWNIQYPLATGRTWSIYRSTDGVNYTYVNSGTYTIVGADQALAPRSGPAAHVPTVK